MIFKTLLIVFTLVFTACGNDQKNNDNNITNAKNTLIGQDNTNLNATDSQGIETNTSEQNLSTPETISPKIPKAVTIYIHGYSKTGYKQQGIYGDIGQDSMIDALAELASLPTMQDYDKNNFTNTLAVTPYYGDEAPAYYTQEDIDDIDAVTKIYGGGIPRYATIIAKFAKFALKESGADHVNIVSASMGSLVTRWLIEKDIEQLATLGKINKWLSIEGVIRGNWVASNSILMGIIDPFEKQHIDTKHMDYEWIKRNLEGISATHPNYKEIEMGFISSTYSGDGVLDILLSANGQLQPNDGVQVLKDTYFSSTPDHDPTYTHFHQDHLGIKKDKGAWAEVATFLSSKKRVKITLVSATIDNLHEDIYFFNKRAEIVFQSKVKSSKIYEKFGVDDEISERIVEGGALNMYKYAKKGVSQSVNQLIFNDFVLEDENELDVKITGYELDKFAIYDVREPSFKSSKASLGTIELNIPLENATIEAFGEDWRGELKVEVIEN